MCVCACACMSVVAHLRISKHNIQNMDAAAAVAASLINFVGERQTVIYTLSRQSDIHTYVCVYIHVHTHKRVRMHT